MQSAYHLRKKIAVLLALLDEHRALEEPHSLHWHEKETEYRRQLCEAQVQLDRVEWQQVA